jgi:hypothetical protein
MGIVGYQTGGGPVILSKNGLRLASPATKATISKASVKPNVVIECHPCDVTGIGSGLAGAVMNSMGYEEIQGTGYDAFSGITVDAWVCSIAIGPTGYGAGLTSGGFTLAGPTYFSNIPWPPTATCMVSLSALSGMAAGIAQQILNNAASFAGAAIKVGASSIAPTAFAGNFLAAGAEATTAAGCIAFIGALIAGLTAPEWIALGLTVAGIGALYVLITSCLP